MTLSHTQRIARQLVKDSKEMLGNGWLHVSADIRRAIVMERVLINALNQDPSINANTVLTTTQNLANEVRKLLGEE